MSSWHNDKCSPTLKNYKSARQDGDTFPDTASQIRSANDTPLPGFLTAGAVRLGAAARSSAGRRLKLRLQRLPISLKQITSSSSGSGDEGSVTSLGALHAETGLWRRLGGQCDRKVLLVGRFAFGCSGSVSKHSPPRTQLRGGHILPPCSPRPVLIIRRGQSVAGLIPRSNLGGTDS